MSGRVGQNAGKRRFPAAGQLFHHRTGSGQVGRRAQKVQITRFARASRIRVRNFGQFVKKRSAPTVGRRPLFDARPFFAPAHQMFRRQANQSEHFCLEKIEMQAELK